jgi:hypothetical protein
MASVSSDIVMVATERVGVGRAAAICGFTPKTMRKLARDGKVPGAAFLGNNWRFDEQQLRNWIRRQEAACQKAAPGRISPS